MIVRRFVIPVGGYGQKLLAHLSVNTSNANEFAEIALGMKEPLLWTGKVGERSFQLSGSMRLREYGFTVAGSLEGKDSSERLCVHIHIASFQYVSSLIGLLFFALSAIAFLGLSLGLLVLLALIGIYLCVQIIRINRLENRLTSYFVDALDALGCTAGKLRH